MNSQEKIFLKLTALQEEHNCDLFEAAILFCEEADLDISEFMEKIDINTVARLKYDAIKSGRVRKCVAQLPNDVLL